MGNVSNRGGRPLGPPRVVPVRASGPPRKLPITLMLRTDVIQRLQAEQRLRQVSTTGQLVEEIIECWLSDLMVDVVRSERGIDYGGEGDAEEHFQLMWGGRKDKKGGAL